MSLILALCVLLSFGGHVTAHRQLIQRQYFDPYKPCLSCLRSSWTQGPECTSDRYIGSVLTLVTNPPPSATSSYTASSFCSGYLRQTDWSSAYVTSTGPSTYSAWTLAEHLVTVTDLNHPTSTKYCAIPSRGMTCGISNPNIVAPEDQQEDWTIEHFYNPEECQQVCLQHDGCKAYRVTRIPPEDPVAWNCEIFNLGLGVNGSNVVSASKGDQWWDRNCGEHLPTECQSTQLPIMVTGSPAIPTYATSIPTITKSTFDISLPTISWIQKTFPPPAPTPAPALLPRHKLTKRDGQPFPDFLTDIDNFYSYPYVLAACSCLISSGLPPLLSTTTFTATEWNATTVTNLAVFATVSTTFEDYFTITVTPRSTTVFQSIN
ncbi:hypothetical protein BKA65DRAFT_70605 [Rhexocercosporidium sp. MPI-PUGE-AT-0058]|nr:hypothetical protein BKA65DRAFT_70605 [Rhexocercosporidium sp. MPI-PUGE-AT-0058]